MDINNLQAFIEVAEKKSFSRSAESMKLTQPAVSKRIASLEAELASRLFDRVGRRVHLTEAGKVLLPSALKISSEVARIENELSSLGKEVGGKLSIGVAEHVSLDKLGMILRSYKTAYPDVDIDMLFAKSTNSFADVESGRLDMCLCAVCELQAINEFDARVAGIEVWKERLQVVVERDHPLQNAGRQNGGLTIEDLARYPGILPEQYCAVRKSIDRLFASRNVEANIAMEAVDFPTTRSMAAIGLGWACLPLSETREDENLVQIDVTDVDLFYSVALVRNPDRTMSRATMAFLDTLPARLM